MLSIPNAAFAAEVEFVIEDGILKKVNGLIGRMIEEITIPSDVVEIGNKVFSGLSQLKIVNIPSSVKSIGKEAFYKSGIQNLYIPSSVEIIEDNAFASCKSLESVYIPKTISSFGRNIFSDCTKLKDVVIEDGICQISNYMFSDCTALTAIDLPSSVSVIGSYAFYGCTSLTSVRFPSGLKLIASGAFRECSSLQSINIPYGTKTIGYNAFRECSNLSEVSLPKSIASINSQSFYKTPCEKSFGDFAIFDDVLLDYQGKGEQNGEKADVIVPYGVRALENMAFCATNGLEITSITLPYSMVELRKTSFFCLGNLEKLVVPDSVTEIANGAIDETVLHSNKLVIYGISGSEIEKYAQKKNIPFVAISRSEIEAQYSSPVSYTPIHTMMDAPEIVSTGIAPLNSGTAYAATQTILVDGTRYRVQMYQLRDENGGTTNYVKLRDVASALNGSKAEFNVDWSPDRGIFISINSPYTTANGQEFGTPYTGDQTYEKYYATTDVNGHALNLQAFTLQSGSYTYYKLRDLGQALNFNVSWSEEKGVFIETDKPYMDD